MIASDGVDELPSLGGQAVPRPLQYSLIDVLAKIDDVGRVSPIPPDECQEGPFERQHLPTKPFLECLIVNHRKGSICPGQYRLDNRVGETRNAAAQGVTPRSRHDCLIAATAVDKRIPLLHDDRDFEHLAQVEPKLKLTPRR
jgi:hypothetical protein